MPGAGTVTLESGEACVVVRWLRTAWVAHDTPLGNDEAAAHALRLLLDLDRPLAHDSRNLIVTSSFGVGAITSRGWPPDHWDYVHGRRLTPMPSAAETLTSEFSRESLELTLARALARTRLLTEQRDKPTRSGERLLAVDDPQLAERLTERLEAVAAPAAEVGRILDELRRLGQALSREDTDGGSFELWRSPTLLIAFTYPDYAALLRGELPDLDDEATHRIIDGCQATVTRLS